MNAIEGVETYLAEGKPTCTLFRWQLEEIASELRRLAAVERDAAMMLRFLDSGYGFEFEYKHEFTVVQDWLLSLPCKPTLPLPDAVRAELEKLEVRDAAD
jgi:hypothetical protein